MLWVTLSKSKLEGTGFEDEAKWHKPTNDHARNYRTAMEIEEESTHGVRILIHQRCLSHPNNEPKSVRKTQNFCCIGKKTKTLATYPLSPRTMTLSKVRLRNDIAGYSGDAKFRICVEALVLVAVYWVVLYFMGWLVRRSTSCRKGEKGRHFRSLSALFSSSTSQNIYSKRWLVKKGVVKA